MAPELHQPLLEDWGGPPAMEGCHYSANPQAWEAPGGDRVEPTDRPLFGPREAHGADGC